MRGLRALLLGVRFGLGAQPVRGSRVRGPRREPSRSAAPLSNRFGPTERAASRRPAPAERPGALDPPPLTPAPTPTPARACACARAHAPAPDERDRLSPRHGLSPERSASTATKPRTSAGALPFSLRTAGDGEQWCGARGKRLCTEDEWVRACQGPHGRRFPYGESHRASACNDDRPWIPVSWKSLALWPDEAAVAEAARLFQADASGARADVRLRGGGVRSHGQRGGMGTA